MIYSLNTFPAFFFDILCVSIIYFTVKFTGPSLSILAKISSNSFLNNICKEKCQPKLTQTRTENRKNMQDLRLARSEPRTDLSFLQSLQAYKPCDLARLRRFTNSMEPFLYYVIRKSRIFTPLSYIGQQKYCFFQTPLRMT
jgi:hypothetical protein